MIRQPLTSISILLRFDPICSVMNIELLQFYYSRIGGGASGFQIGMPIRTDRGYHPFGYPFVRQKVMRGHRRTNTGHSYRAREASRQRI